MTEPGLQVNLKKDPEKGSFFCAKTSITIKDLFKLNDEINAKRLAALSAASLLICGVKDVICSFYPIRIA